MVFFSVFFGLFSVFSNFSGLLCDLSPVLGLPCVFFTLLDLISFSFPILFSTGDFSGENAFFLGWRCFITCFLWRFFFTVAIDHTFFLLFQGLDWRVNLHGLYFFFFRNYY